MRVLSIGEILWDVIENDEYLGGAPFNLCVHLAQLEHQASLVSAVGNDPRGNRALEQATLLKVNTDWIGKTAEAATGVSQVQIDEEGHGAHCLPRPAAYDYMTLSPEQRRTLAAQKPDWLCFGTLAQMQEGPRKLVRQILDENPAAKRFYDVNLRPGSWSVDLVKSLFALATAVKLNHDEEELVSGFFDWPRASHEEFAGFLAERFPKIELICVTLAGDGCFLWHKGESVQLSGYPVHVVDTVGAGDAFSAALLHGLSQGSKLDEIADFANRVGALMASRAGATPAWTVAEALALTK